MKIYISLALLYLISCQSKGSIDIKILKKTDIRQNVLYLLNDSISRDYLIDSLGNILEQVSYNNGKPIGNYYNGQNYICSWGKITTTKFIERKYSKGDTMTVWLSYNDRLIAPIVSDKKITHREYFKMKIEKSKPAADYMGSLVVANGKIHEFSNYHYIENKSMIVNGDSLDVKVSLRYAYLDSITDQVLQYDSLNFKIYLIDTKTKLQSNFPKGLSYIKSSTNELSFKINKYDLGENVMQGIIVYYSGVRHITTNRFMLEFFVVEDESQLLENILKEHNGK